MGQEQQTGIQFDQRNGVYTFSNNYRANFGYKVISLNKGSPGKKAGLEPMLDFILYMGSSTANQQEEKKLLFSEYLQ